MRQNIVERGGTFAHRRFMSDAVEISSSDEKPSPGQWLWGEVKFFGRLFLFIIAFLTLVWGHFKIPSESMQPALEVGDHIYVSKFAYGYSKHSLPYLLHKLPLPEGRIFSRLPKRGDVVVFRNQKNGIVMIKRLVGLPGDRVQMRAGELYLNGELVPRTQVDARMYRDHPIQRVVGVQVYSQTLPGSEASFLIYERNDDYPLDDTAAFEVPEDHLFFMGDNRDNSTDSRAGDGPEMVPVNNIMGRADRMMFSFKKCDRDEDLYCPPKGRIMEKL